TQEMTPKQKGFQVKSSLGAFCKVQDMDQKMFDWYQTAFLQVSISMAVPLISSLFYKYWLYYLSIL
ncbi:hypothetical protein, partial [Staphylococcus aureus]|uniref:hypothetical protein n=1 Tax=Staphylococcus aureus TaxID=1280 RepID=UPI0038B3E373